MQLTYIVGWSFNHNIASYIRTYHQFHHVLVPPRHEVDLQVTGHKEGDITETTRVGRVANAAGSWVI